MKDIARDLGVSVVTVSKVLRNHEDISEATRKRVLDRVKEFDYTPNLAARGLVTGKTYLVGLWRPTCCTLSLPRWRNHFQGRF